MEPLPPIKELRASIQPDPKKETVWYAKYVIRKVSILITWLLLHTPISANQATVIQVILGLAGAALLAFGGFKWSILALFLIQLGYVFDCVDGEIARYRKKPTVNGIFLDSLNHALVIPAMFLGLAIFSFYLVNESWVLIVGSVLAIVSADPVKKAVLSTLFYMLERQDNPKYKYENLVQDVGGSAPPASALPVPQKAWTLKSLVLAVAKDISEYPTSMNIITVVVLADLLVNHYFTWEALPLSLMLMIFYTLFLATKEAFFLLKVYSNRTIEKKFLDFIK